MSRLKAIVNSQWFFPMFILYYGIGYMFFGGKYYLNEGLSMDGFVFSTFVSHLKVSYFFDGYYVHRILPSLFVGLFFKYLPFEETYPHIFNAFQILNIACLFISCIFLKKIFVLLKITLKNQLLGFVLVLINFAILKMPFHLAVMTDTSAFMLSVLMLYFYLKKYRVGLVLITILACFTWEVLFYQGIILVLIPFSTLPYASFKPSFKWFVQFFIAAIAMGICLYLVLVEKADTKMEFVAKINRPLLPLSIAGLTFLFFFFSKIFLNKNLLDLKLFFKRFKFINILFVVFIIALTTLMVWYLNPPPAKFYQTNNILRGTFTSALIWPFHNIVSHTTFWGMIVILLIFFWNDFGKIISQMGWGIVAAFGLNLFAFGILPETRCLVNMLPWIVVFLIKAINRYSFSKWFYIIIAIFSLFVSKIWLVLNPPAGTYNSMNLDRNGCMGFPDQKMWMHIGPWMNEEMYYIQGGVMLLLMAILFFMLYKFQFNDRNKIVLVARYK